MNVGKDPFPRDEVTGLAAFDHVEPLRSHSVVPEDSVETPVVTGDSGEAESGLQARLPSASASNTQRARADVTLPLNLTAMPHWQESVVGENDEGDSDEDGDDTELLDVDAAEALPELPVRVPRQDETLIGAAVLSPQLTSTSETDSLSALDATLGEAAVPSTPHTSLTSALSETPSGPAAPAPQPSSALDAMFDAAGGGWDDEDEATRVHSHPAGRAPLSASLDMEWDEDEPATEMRPFAMFDAPPLAARHDEWTNTDDATSTYLPPRGGSGIRSATPTMRVPTPPLQTTLPPVQPGAKALSGGRPSPFPTNQPSQKLVGPALADASDNLADDDDFGDDDAHDAHDAHQDRDERDHARASAFDGLVPVPAPQLPAAASPGARKSVGEASPQLPAAARAPLWESGGELPARFLDALKAGHKPSIVMAASGCVGLVALVLIVRALAAGGAGTAVLEVSPADAQVQVDGKAVSGTSSPYTVSELTPGTHEIVVVKPGYNEYRGSFPVTAGANTKLPVIELAANLRDVGFSVRSVPAGAAVWVDGERSEALTPAKLTGIKPGIHRIALKHDGYSDYELQMFVPEATVLQLPAAELVALPAAPVEPVRLGRRSRRTLSADEAEGYSARRTTRRTEAGESERSSRAERTSYTSSYGTRRNRAADSDEEVSPRAAPAADGGKMGTLRLNSRPWAQVTLDGQPIGNTPQQNLQLSPGKHKLQLANPQLGLTKSVTVNIKAGEIQTQVVNLAE